MTMTVHDVTTMVFESARAKGMIMHLIVANDNQALYRMELNKKSVYVEIHAKEMTNHLVMIEVDKAHKKLIY